MATRLICEACEKLRAERGVAIGVRVKQLRTAKGLSLEALARESGISQTHLRDMERGNIHSPNRSTLKILSLALGCRPEDILPGDGE